MPFRCAIEVAELVQEKLLDNPLIREIKPVLGRVAGFKKRAREYYFEVVLSCHKCPACDGRLQMTSQSQCSCVCGKVFDPTLAFQKSPCCSARLVRKTFHYACSRCNKGVPSRFLFDEKLFDATYFREAMREFRTKTKKKREEIRRLLAGSRSDALPLLEEPDLKSIPGLVEDLNSFVQTNSVEPCDFSFDAVSSFQMDKYREHILSTLGWNRMLFSKITPLIDNRRLDTVWRFVTLIFMQHDGEVDLTQYGNDLFVERVCDEAYCEGQRFFGTAQIAP
jgi:hypothetical protein